MAANGMHLEDWLDDLCVRFIINLPQEDLSSVARICFQVEEAQWFYEDFVRPLDPTLPSMSLRTFCLRIFQHCPLLASFSVENHTKAFEEFLEYKTRVPVRGAIMLNHAMDSVLLVKGWKKSATWSFPRGKINKDEADLDCAIREVYEETGLDLRAAGLVPTEKRPKYIEITMREQQLRLYVFRDIPMDTDFQPRTRKEISKIQWYKLSELPAFRKKGSQGHNEANPHPAVNRFYMVAPFLFPLKKWIVSQRKLDERKEASGMPNLLPYHVVGDEMATTEDDALAPVAQQQRVEPHGPTIDTLDGATRELQRLLKMQPPTQGLQPQPQTQEDKGTALLSILQSSNRQAQQHDQPVSLPHIPFTPHQDHLGDVTPPHNPHHQSNQHHGHIDTHQPPPSFSLPSNPGQASNAPGPAQPNQLRHVQQPQPYMSPGPPGTSFSQPYQPSAAQISMPPNTSSNHFPMNHYDGASHIQSPAPPGPAKLSSASLALLNAFKRDPVTPPTQQAKHQEAFLPSASSHAAFIPPYMRTKPPSSSIEQLVDRSISRPEPPNPTLPLSDDSRRSALLTMFKKGPASPSARHASSPSLPVHPPQPSKADNALAQQLQRNRGPKPNPTQNKPSLPLPPLRTTPPQSRRSLTNPRQTTQLQSPRILRRGQTLDDVPPAPSPRDQKMELLSLFGRAAPVDPAPESSVDVPRSRVSSMASRGDETPISPVQQDIFLSYLQSVTSNPERR